MAEERENKILEERRSRTIWIRKNGRGEKDRESKKDVAAILLTKKRNKGAGKERGKWCGSKGQLKNIKPFGPLAYSSNLYKNCLDENKGLRHHHEVQGRC